MKTTVVCIIEGVIILVLVGILFLCSKSATSKDSLALLEKTQKELSLAKEDNDKLQKEIKSAKSDSLAESANYLMEKSNFKDTIKQLETENKELKEKVLVLSTKPEEIYEQADKAFHNNEYEKAKRLLDQVFSVYPSKEKDSHFKFLYSRINEAIEKEKDKILNREYISKNEDFMQGATWYKSTRNCTYDNSANYKDEEYEVRLYCGKFDDGSKNLRLKVHYSGKDWIFIDGIQFKNTDGTDITLSLKRESEVFSGSVSEWADVLVSSNKTAFKDLLKSDTIFIRLKGKYIRDWEMTREQKLAFIEIIDVFESLETSSK